MEVMVRCGDVRGGGEGVMWELMRGGADGMM